MVIPQQFIGGRSPCAVWLSSLLAAICLSGCSAYDPTLLGNSAELSGPSVDGGARDSGSAGSTTCKAGVDLTICTRPHADGVCLSGDCTIVRCRDNYSDCDGLADNGCETTLDTLDSCGACGSRCALNRVVRNRCNPSAGSELCTVDHGCQAGDVDCKPEALANGCEPGFGDCDGLAGNGCEASLHTLGNCGACGNLCESSVAQASCDTGKCVLAGCSKGFGDCDGKGCKKLSDDPKNCGGCAVVCNSDAPMCAGGRCTSKTCKEDQADCDGKESNGCEADLTAPETCGSCSVTCGPYDNASAGCVDGQCSVTACAPGFADCDESRDNGCETDITQNAHCGGCGTDCGNLPHATSAACTAAVCTNLVCETGWGDCDGAPENGCEQPLNTPDHCETCTGTCSAAHGSASCDTGKCVVSSCEEGFDDCNGGITDGCEAALNTSADCGKCANKCSSGTACQNGGCTCSGGCSKGSECCGNSCVDTRGSCVPWPCIPGTSRDKNNCGGCGVKCNGSCCG